MLCPSMGYAHADEANTYQNILIIKGNTMYTLNTKGVYHIQSWIDSNQDKNPKVFDLWAGGIASEIGRLDVDEELTNNGRYSYELGMKDGQGHILFIYFYPEHFDYEEVQS